MNKKQLLSFFDTQQHVMLSTISLDGTHPQTRALVNLRYKNATSHLKDTFRDRIFFMTNSSTAKVAEIKKNPNACVYTHDGGDTGLMLTGDIKIVTDPTVRGALWKDFLTLYYPDGLDGDQYTILEFIPTRYRYYRDEGLTTTSGDITAE